MGQDFYNCGVCGEIFGDYSDYGICGGCETFLCGECNWEMKEKNGVLGEDHENASIFGEDAVVSCDCCDGTKVKIIVSEEEALKYLDDSIDKWRSKKDNESDPNAHHYIDAFKIVRSALFGGDN